MRLRAMQGQKDVGRGDVARLERDIAACEEKVNPKPNGSNAKSMAPTSAVISKTPNSDL